MEEELENYEIIDDDGNTTTTTTTTTTTQDLSQELSLLDKTTTTEPELSSIQIFDSTTTTTSEKTSTTETPNLTTTATLSSSSGSSSAASTTTNNTSSNSSTTNASSHDDQLPPKKANAKLQPSPSSASSYSNTSSLFRDDGFEDDFVSTASDRTSTYQSSASSTRTSQQSNHRLSFQGRHHLLRLSYHQYHSGSSSPSSGCSLPTSKPLNLATKNNQPGYLDSNLSISQRVVTEIIETERTYVDDLEQIVTGYICFLRKHLIRFNSITKPKHLKQQQQTQENEMVTNNNTTNNKSCNINNNTNINVNEDGAIMTANQIEKLFSNLEDIYKFNKDLLFRLEECYLNPSSVAECFVENSAGFDVYTHYCTTYPIVVSTLTELMANPASAQLLKERQEKLGQSLPLGSYLLKPVQRILKYHILFQSLITHTANDEIVDKDRQVISEAFSVMSNIAGHINSMKRRHEHAIRVQEVQALLTGWRGPDLTTLGELILEDSFKIFDRPKSTKHLLLFDNVLLITKKKRDGTLAYKNHIECCNLMLIENIKGQPLVFETVPFDNPKALYAFQARTLDKKRDWCLQMKEVIIKSFDNKIPRHVRDLLMSLTTKSTNDTDTNNDNSTTDSTSRTVKAPNYLEKKNKNKQDKKK